jgi:colicin import membrane protein
VGFLSNYIVPTLFTVLLHLLVIFTVLVGWQLSDTRRFRVETPHFVKAELVSLEQKQTKAPAEPATPIPVAKSAPEPDSEPADQEPAAAAEPDNSADAAASANSVRALERQRRLEQEQQYEQERLRDEQLRRQREAEFQRHLQQQREKEERARQEARQRQQQQQQALQRAMQEEEMLMQAEQDEIQAASYAALIKRTVESYWSRPPSARKDMQVELAIRLVPTGEVVGVEVTRSSGNTSFDRSAVLAVRKAGRFPELKDLPSSVFEEYFRSFTLVFKPEDLLL